MNKNIRFIIPCYNEEKNIKYIYNLINSSIKDIKNKYNFNFLFINDGSIDNTEIEINKLLKNKNNISYINLSRNFGKESAMYAGLENSKNFDAIIFIDADGQDNPNIIPLMLNEYENGYNDVYGKRKSRKDNNCINSLLCYVFYKSLNIFSKYNIPEEVGDFRLLDKKCILALIELKEKNRYTKGIFSFIGFKKKQIEFDRLNRVNGKSKWNILKKINFAIEAYINFSQLLYIIPFILFLLSIPIIFIFLLVYLNDIDNTQKMILLLFSIILNILMISISIIIKILLIVLEECKNRDIYIKK